MGISDHSSALQAEKLQQKITSTIAEIDAVADKFPGVIIMHNIRSWEVV